MNKWKPASIVLKFILWGSVIALILTVMNYYIIKFRWSNYAGFLLVGYCMVLLGWGSNRLWHDSIRVMVKNPVSMLAYTSRLPFWYLAGGMGYTLGMLMAKKYGLLSIYDMPVKLLFRFGGILGCIFQLSQNILQRRLSSAKV